MKRYHIVLGIIAVIFTLSTITSCKKKEGCTDPTALNYNAKAKKKCSDCCKYKEAPSSQTQKLFLHIHSEVNGSPLVYNQEYTQQNGRKYKFTQAYIYFSKPNLDNTVNFNDKYLLVSPAVDEFELGEVAAGHYHHLHLLFGIDATVNHTDPSSYTSSHALSPQSPSMHWNTTDGYIFIRLEGMVDTTLAMNGPLDAHFMFQVGLDANAKNIELMVMHDVHSGTNSTIHTSFNFGKLFENVDLRLEKHGMSNGMGASIADKIANNVPAALTVE